MRFIEKTEKGEKAGKSAISWEHLFWFGAIKGGKPGFAFPAFPPNNTFIKMPPPVARIHVL